MFVEFYGLSKDPFSPVGDRHLYLSASHRKALASLYYDIEYGGGIDLLLGGAGVGKTTLLRYLESRLQTADRVVVSAAGGKEIGSAKLLTNDSNGHQSNDSAHSLKVKIDDCKSENGSKQRLVVLADDAHELGDIELSDLLALGRAAGPEAKRVHLVLAGRPELLEKLEQLEIRDAFRQVWIGPLGIAETEDYIKYRLELAAGSRRSIFMPSAYEIIARQSEGIPRAINRICAEALLAGARGKQKQIEMSVADGNEAAHRSRVLAPAPEEKLPRPHLAFAASNKRLRSQALLGLSFLIILAILFYGKGSDLRRAFSDALEGEPVAVAPLSRAVSQSAPIAATVGSKARLSTNVQSEGATESAKPQGVEPPKNDLTAPASTAIAPVANQEKAQAQSTARMGTETEKSERTQSNQAAQSAEVNSIRAPRGIPAVAPPLAANPEKAQIQSATATSSGVSSARSSNDEHGVTPIAAQHTDARSNPTPLAAPINRTAKQGRISKLSNRMVTAEDTHRAQVYAGIGDDYVRLGKYGDAIDFYRDALAITPNDASLQEKIKQARAKASGE